MNITLVSQDGTKISAPLEITERCSMLKRLLEDSIGDETIPVEVDSKILNEIISFWKQREFKPQPAIPKPLPTADLKQILSTQNSQWLSKFNEEEAVDILDVTKTHLIRQLVS